MQQASAAIPGLWYGWVFCDDPAQLVLIDSGHLLLGHVAAGVILGGWR